MTTDTLRLTVTEQTTKRDNHYKDVQEWIKEQRKSTGDMDKYEVLSDKICKACRQQTICDRKIYRCNRELLIREMEEFKFEMSQKNKERTTT